MSQKRIPHTCEEYVRILHTVRTNSAEYITHQSWNLIIFCFLIQTNSSYISFNWTSVQKHNTTDRALASCKFIHYRRSKEYGSPVNALEVASWLFPFILENRSILFGAAMGIIHTKLYNYVLTKCF